MGRTRRKRKSKKIFKGARQYKIGSNKTIIELMQWLTRNGWKKDISLYPTEFVNTGRGLMTKRSLRKGDILVTIPFHLLITAHTVCKSEIYDYIDKTHKYNGHEILAFYLVWEKHLREKSFWHPYINTLPEKLSTPLFWAKDPINLPEFIDKEIQLSKTTMQECYNSFLKHLRQQKCFHCNLEIHEIFNEKKFTWAWCIINTRAIYIPPEKNLHNICNSLALAPFLDLFNHVPDAKVEAMLIETKNVYQVKTLIPVSKNKQVFIEYGAHSNLKLLIDYGFTIPNNSNDFIALTLEEIYDVIKKLSQITIINLSQEKYKFLKHHNLLKNPCLTKDGMCWKTISIIFIFITEISNLKLLESKVYSSLYSQEEISSIKAVGFKLIENKLKLFRLYSDRFVSTESNHTTIGSYLKICINLLKECLTNVNEKFHEFSL